MEKIFKTRSRRIKGLFIIFISISLLIVSLKAAPSQTLNFISKNPQYKLLAQHITTSAHSSSSTNELSFMRIDHVEIRVPNFEETVRWYKEKLGFREQVDWTVKALLGMQLADLELNGFRLEIIGGSFTSKRKAPSNFQEALNVEGYGHICFEVGNVDAVLAELNKRGVSTFVLAATYPLGNTWRRVGFVLDNNSNVIEFAEPLTMTRPRRT